MIVELVACRLAVFWGVIGLIFDLLLGLILTFGIGLVYQGLV